LQVITAGDVYCSFDNFSLTGHSEQTMNDTRINFEQYYNMSIRDKTPTDGSPLGFCQFKKKKRGE